MKHIKRFRSSTKPWDSFLVGVNYWPRKKAMYWWKEFDAAEVDQEFKEIRDLNLRVVRIFPIWEDFQPHPQQISQTSMSNLKTVLDTASKHNLKIILNLFIGFMSGVNWVPYWALNKGGPRSVYPSVSQGKLSRFPIKDLYEDPFMLKAEKLLLRAFVSAFKDHLAIFAWELSNEVDNLLVPRIPQAAKKWHQTTVREIKKIDPQHPVTNGLHQENLETDRHIHLQDVAQILDYPTMHGYSGYAAWGRGPLDSDVPPFCNVLATSLGEKPVLFGEFGVCTSRPEEPSRTIGVRSGDREYDVTLVNEEKAARYYEEVLRKLYRVGSLGAMAWCFSDYDEAIWDKPPLNACVHERFFGVTRTDGSLKPMGKVLRDFAAKSLRVQPPIRVTVPRKTYYLSPLKNLKAAFTNSLKDDPKAGVFID